MNKLRVIRRDFPLVNVPDHHKYRALTQAWLQPKNANV